MKNLSIYLISLFVVLSSMTSCENWLDVNTSPDNPTTVTVDQILPVVVFYTSQLEYDHAEYGAYLSQCLTTGGRSQTGSYAYKQGWDFLTMNRHPQWRRHYYDLGVNIFEMTNVAKKIESRNFALIGRTIRLYSTLMTTDAFGDMPMRESYGHIESLREFWDADFYDDRSTLQPIYDSQEDIYDWMLREVDDLIKLYEDPAWVECPTNMRIDKKMDRIYAGDLGKWKAFTKALKARILLRKLPNWDNNIEACNQIIAAVDDCLNDPNWEEPRYVYSADGSGEKNCPWGPMQPIINGWESRGNLLTDAIPSRFFGQYLLGMYTDLPSNRVEVAGLSLDPRASRMMSPRGGADNNGNTQSATFRYLDNNKGMDISMKAILYPDLYGTTDPIVTNPFTRDNGYIAIYTLEELLFIKAEAQYWLAVNQGQKIKNEAYITTLEAVQASMTRYGVEPANSADDASLEAKRHAWFLEIRLPSAEDFTIADLMQQKYVAMYLQSQQWVDFRRYNQSSETNGITYDGVFVYTVTKVHDEKAIIGFNPNKFKKDPSQYFTAKKSLTRPFNLYEAYWTTAVNYGNDFIFSPNAWVQRLNYDPETEDKYNVNQLIKLGAYKNSEWLRKRMVWAYFAKPTDNPEANYPKATSNITNYVTYEASQPIK